MREKISKITDVFIKFWVSLSVGDIILITEFVWFTWLMALYCPTNWQSWASGGLISIFAGFATAIIPVESINLDEILSNAKKIFKFIFLFFCATLYCFMISENTNNFFIIFPNNFWEIMIGVLLCGVFIVYLALLKLCHLLLYSKDDAFTDDDLEATYPPTFPVGEYKLLTIDTDEGEDEYLEETQEIQENGEEERDEEFTLENDNPFDSDTQNSDTQ